MLARLRPYLAPLCLALLYLGVCFRFSYHTAGLEEDEAVSFRGAATLADHVSAPCRKGHDIPFLSACLPVMVAPYVGAPKDYFLLPFFLVLGAHTWVARMGAAVLGALGILGCWLFLRKLFGPVAAGISAGFLALNPSYIDAPIFDQGNIAFSLGIFGLLLILILMAAARPSHWRFFFLGLGVGLGLWGRLNFAWLVFAGAVAIFVTYRRELRRLFRFFPAMTVGCLLGAFPLLGYLALRGRHVAEFMATSSVAQTFSERSVSTLASFRDVLLASREHREGIWHAARISNAPSLAVLILIVVAFAWCLFTRAKVPKAIAFCSGLLLLLYLSSNLPIAAHHLVIFVPLAALLIGIIFAEFWRASRPGQIAVAVLCCAYVVSASRIDAESATRLHQTGGYGEWSSSINNLDELLESQYSSNHLYALDWGFSDPLFVLSKGKLRAQELFWNPNENDASPGVTWAKLIGDGGTFVTYSEENLHFPEATTYFQQTLEGAGVRFRKVELQQRDHSAYANVFIVPPSPGGVTFTPSEMTTFRASPSTVKPDQNGLGKTSLVFSTKKSHLVEIHVGAPDGQLLARFSSAQRAATSGVATTGNWVRDGMTFYLQDVEGKPLTSQNTLATVKVTVAK